MVGGGVKKIVSYLKRLKGILATGFNFILVFLIYWIGVTLSFLLFKLTEIRKRAIEAKTYWVYYKRTSKDHHRQY